MQLSKNNQEENNGRFQVAQTSNYEGNDFWNWGIWIEGTDAELDQIQQVTYNLHYTFPKPVRIINTRPNKFRLDSSGWGTFTIYIRIQLVNEAYIDLEHELELFYPYEEQSSEADVSAVTNKSDEFRQLTEDINNLKQKLHRTDFPEQTAMLERTLQGKISEWETLRSSINDVVQTISNKNSDTEDWKIEQARGFFDQGDFRAASQALE